MAFPISPPACSTTRRERDRLRLEIEATIRRFEPRFLSVRVHSDRREQRWIASLRLRIEAVLHADPAPEQVTFDTDRRYRERQRADPRPRRRLALMSDTLLPYYDRELKAIHRLAERVRRGVPEDRRPAAAVAGGVDDPHVARLLDGVAFLAARVHHRLDDEFPELTDALLGMLYPHYLAPVPSCMVARLDCRPTCRRPTRCRRAPVRDRTGARRGAALSHHRAGDAVADRGRECPPDRTAARRAGQSGRRGCVAVLRITLKCAGAGHDVHPTGRRPAALLPARRRRTRRCRCMNCWAVHVVSVAFADAAGRSGAGDRAGRGRASRLACAATKRCCPGRPAVFPVFAC